MRIWYHLNGIITHINIITADKRTKRTEANEKTSQRQLSDKIMKAIKSKGFGAFCYCCVYNFYNVTGYVLMLPYIASIVFFLHRMIETIRNRLKQMISYRMIYLDTFSFLFWHVPVPTRLTRTLSVFISFRITFDLSHPIVEWVGYSDHILRIFTRPLRRFYLTRKTLNSISNW